MADKPSRGLADVIAGSTAVSEQHADNRLIRPDGEHIGERGLTWVPVGQR